MSSNESQIKKVIMWVIIKIDKKKQTFLKNDFKKKNWQRICLLFT